MALTDEQYNHISRYADGEMDTDERKAFEAALLEKKELYDEVEFYKQIQSLSESVEQKTTNTDLSVEKINTDKKVWTLINDARKNWESQYENDLKLKYGFAEAKNISAEEKKYNTRRIDISRWLIAATLIGLISVGVFWWYSNNTKNVVTVDKKKTDSINVTNNKKIDSVENIVPIQPTPSQENTTSENLAKNKEKEKLGVLFANNFQPDSAPPDKEGPLENAFFSYENKQYEKASRDFEEADIGPITRGDQEDHRKLMTFYIHYYKALSYMATKINISKAITELNTAITASPDEEWKAKAQWYLALAHLRKGEAQPALALLKQVAVNDDAKELKQKAIALSKTLNED